MIKDDTRDCNTSIPVFRNTGRFSNTEIPVLRQPNTGICGIAIFSNVAHKNDQIGKNYVRYNEYSRFKVVSMTICTSVYCLRRLTIQCRRRVSMYSLW